MGVGVIARRGFGNLMFRVDFLCMGWAFLEFGNFGGLFLFLFVRFWGLGFDVGLLV